MLSLGPFLSLADLINNRGNDLYGNVPDTSPIALLIIDMINDLEFPEGDKLEEPARVAADTIVDPKRRAKASNIPGTYANDNFGRWRSDVNDVVENGLKYGIRGQFLAEVPKPESDDYFVLKPRYSAFYATTLNTLRTYLQAKHLILTGLGLDSCILFTANDAFRRLYSSQFTFPFFQ